MLERGELDLPSSQSLREELLKLKEDGPLKWNEDREDNDFCRMELSLLDVGAILHLELGSEPTEKKP